MTGALVKVIVPCYRYGHYLDRCIGSVLSQEGVDVRALIIDDHSPDGTPAVARRLVRHDERLEYRRHERNLGLTATANEGLEWAEDSDYLLLLSADDLLVPGSLRRAASVLDSQSGVGLVYGHAQYFQSGNQPARVRARWRGTKVWPGADWIRLRCRSAHNCISSPEAVVRTSVVRQVGAYDPACYHTTDLNMWLRIAAVSDVAYIKGAVQALYRIHSKSMLRSDGGAMVDLTERRAAFESFFAGAGAALADGDRLRAMAARALARQALWQASRAYDRGEIATADGPPVEELIAFALETYPETPRLREWRGLQLRRRIGAGRSIWFPPFVATGAAHRLRGHFDQLRWRTRGV